jgi:hypothetical protein
MEPGPHTGNCADPKSACKQKNDSPRVVETRVSAGPCQPANACQIHDVVDGHFLGSSAAGVSILHSRSASPLCGRLRTLQSCSSINTRPRICGRDKKAETSFPPGGRYRGSPFAQAKNLPIPSSIAKMGPEPQEMAFPRISPFPSCHRLEPSQAKRQGNSETKQKKRAEERKLSEARTLRLCPLARMLLAWGA